MDRTSERLVSYTRDFSESELSVSAVAKATDLLFDSMACAVAGAGPARLVARVAQPVRSDPGVFSEAIMGHSGHPDRLQSDRRDVINTKLDLCAQTVQMQPQQRERIREAWWNVAQATDIGDAIKTMAGFCSLDRR